MSIRFDIVTIFPEFFAGIFEHGIVRRAQAEGLVTVDLHDLRAFTHDRHRTVDDRPFGGGEGMVLKPEPLAEALKSLGIRPMDPPEDSQKQVPGFAEQSGSAQDDRSRTLVVLLSAQGRPFTQALARELAELERVVLICGRYEGVDERINQLYCNMELSIGDYVLSGGELAAAVVVDAVMRLVPGVLGNEASGAFESFGVADCEIARDGQGVPRSQHGAGGLLDYPHYTRPAEFGGLATPEVLLNGDHAQIRRWRREQQLRKTLANRPDLLDKASLSDEDRRFLESVRKHV
ncbi:MAG TPA: tRNA (guanosine(37)-N1)-methyltransferase TrmD [Terracidiphilus sp.]|nr:tRNA (guanosine(37)-N1)-methyltransferase TrmD [Terracidiphilus sp.]